MCQWQFTEHRYFSLLVGWLDDCSCSRADREANDLDLHQQCMPKKNSGGLCQHSDSSDIEFRWISFAPLMWAQETYISRRGGLPWQRRLKEKAASSCPNGRQPAEKTTRFEGNTPKARYWATQRPGRGWFFPLSWLFMCFVWQSCRASDEYHSEDTVRRSCSEGTCSTKFWPSHDLWTQVPKEMVLPGHFGLPVS